MKRRNFRKGMPLVIVFMIIVSSPNAFPGSEAYSVKKIWETEKVLNVPESVYYDSLSETLYVSNINGNSSRKDRNGFISQLSPQGKILKLKWAEGLNAPKGITIFKNKLYVSDLDELVCLSLSDGKILKKMHAPGALFLNDVAADHEGNIYISDSSKKNSTIYRYKAGQIEAWLKSDEIKSPNGLFCQDGILYVGNSGDGQLKAVDIKTKKITTVAKVGSGIDGLIRDKTGFFLVSDWKGKTRLIDKSGNLHLLIDTTQEKVNAADLGYIPEKRIILVPTFFDNRIVAYKLILNN